MHPHFTSHLIRTCLAVTMALTLAAQFESSAIIQYTAEEVVLGFEPRAMNNRGWIVGYLSGGSEVGDYPMRYRPGVGTEQISSFKGILNDINDAGTAVGYLYVDGRTEAIVRPAGALWTRIGNLGRTPSVAFAINESGHIVGRSKNALGRDVPFLYTEVEGMKALSDQEGQATEINEAGQVAGNLNGGRGFLWDPVQGFIDIQDWAGLDRRFSAGGLTGSGTVAGYMGRGLTTFSLTSGLRRIGDVRAGVTTANERGWIAGSMGSGPDNRAFLYVYGQGIRDLNSLLVAPLQRPLSYVVDINDRDEILAFADGTTGRHYYILKRVRE